MDPGMTLHVKVVDVVSERGRPVIEFEVLDEGPHLGEHLQGHPAEDLSVWMATILDSFNERALPVDRLLHRSCRAVIGVRGRLRQRCVVSRVLPA